MKYGMKQPELIHNLEIWHKTTKTNQEIHKATRTNS